MKLSTINTAVQSFLLHGDAFEQACIDLQRLFKGVARETVKETVCPMVSAYYVAKGVANSGYVGGKWEDKDGAAKKKANRLLITICGTSSPATSSKTVVKLTRVQKAAVAALLAAFGGDAKAAKAAIQ
jgi:hypothetical protein